VLPEEGEKPGGKGDVDGTCLGTLFITLVLIGGLLNYQRKDNNISQPDKER
jgi:hypothetical protein